MNSTLTKNNSFHKEELSLNELCSYLSISTATGKNWIKLGKLTPTTIQNSFPMFSKEYASELKNNISTGNIDYLKSRRNKKYVIGNSLYESYVSVNSKNIKQVEHILEYIHNIKHFSLNNLMSIIANAAIQLIIQNNNIQYISNEPLLLDYLNNKIKLDTYDEFLLPLIDNIDMTKNFIKNNIDLFNIQFIFEKNEDILGFIYISCKNLSERKSNGQYYTPNNIVKKLVNNIKFKEDEKIIDPCCGTGNFLLKLPDQIKPNNIYGNDIDQNAIKIARINYKMKYNILDNNIVLSHITNKDFIFTNDFIKYDVIIGNPPWGAEFNAEQKNFLTTIYKSAIGKNIESFDLAIEKSLNLLNQNGILAFVLPESILNVKTHKSIREIIAKNNKIISIEYLGNAFNGVQCPAIILIIKHTNRTMDTIGLKIINNNDNFTIQEKRNIDTEYFNFNMTNEEYNIFNKISNIKNKITLLNNADFALGIVTGNNSKYISEYKTNKNELVLKGTDIYKYKFKPSNNFITFKPEEFQQVAPIQFYRANEKLLYRFISNKLVFSYDNQKTLSLNSCNIVIPKINNLNIKYIMAILNSSIVQFYFSKKFNSIKILRSHIEDIPIPIIDIKSQSAIINDVDAIINEKDKIQIENKYKLLDKKIADLYKINSFEYNIIQQINNNENIFLY